jgi:PIN domain nuclease of toxin-antitoxin system
MWELGIKYALGKLPLPVSPRDFFAREIATRGYRVLDVKRAHAERAAELAYVDAKHRDPFDRMLVSQARAEHLTLVTHDEVLTRYDVTSLRV